MKIDISRGLEDSGRKMVKKYDHKRVKFYRVKDAPTDVPAYICICHDCGLQWGDGRKFLRKCRRMET
ncbi:hypothetical protein LCGC14_1192200 [marine sediment metagenome]|uniref:Uncharacterized protein n=1 Tax=marine sediment metagenome TaxID=412755 RepID=A0A0F9M6U2_9ZZZZ